MIINSRETCFVVTVPVGTYVLGDPCYCFPDMLETEGAEPRDPWYELGKSCDWWCNTPIATMGMPNDPDQVAHVLGFSTAYGDGQYHDNLNRVYYVDAGLIGLVPIELIRSMGTNIETLGQYHHLVAFDHPTTCSCHKGLLKFGPIVIDTRATESDDE